MKVRSLLLIWPCRPVQAYLSIVRPAVNTQCFDRGGMSPGPARFVSASDTTQPVRYFLFKSEPSEFSIHDLKKQKGSMDEWDGVRNFEARNIMRVMQVGDKAFFYHSSCKDPGIVGTVSIVREAEPDATAYEDPGHAGYDPKSTPENCRWDSVRVRLESIFPVAVTLKELKAVARTNPLIADMSLLRRSRLSIHRISEEEWKMLHDLVEQKSSGNQPELR